MFLHVLVTQKNHPIETVLLSTHNIRFGFCMFVSSLTLCMLGNFACLFVVGSILLKVNLIKIPSGLPYHLYVKQFGP